MTRGSLTNRLGPTYGHELVGNHGFTVHNDALAWRTQNPLAPVHLELPIRGTRAGRFWSIRREGHRKTVVWSGEIGTPGISKVELHPDSDAASAYKETSIAAKMAQGYGRATVVSDAMCSLNGCALFACWLPSRQFGAKATEM
jgi:predicted DNA-binding WGR domain protein